MNFITTNHMGGLCNVMFKLAASISLSLDNDVEYLFSNEFIRQIDKDIVCGGFDDYRIYYDNILRNIKFIDKLPSGYRTHSEPDSFNYGQITYHKGENLLLYGYYQSEKYFINNKDFIINLFKPTNEIQEEKPLILSKSNLVKEENTIVENQTTIKEAVEEKITEPSVVKKINKKLSNNIFKLISDDYYYNREPSTLEISHLTKIIKKRVILKDVSVTVNPQEIVALLGPNGAGKTTMFSIVLGILNPTQGKVIFNNKVINELPIHMRAKEGISYLPQSRSIFRGLTVEENIRAVAEVAIIRRFPA
jgi:ABC-type multidrug transport system fused ATPase/permease subunit